MVDNRVSQRDGPSESESQEGLPLVDLISQFLIECNDPPESREEDLTLDPV
jgi:hypothetical protein